MIRGLPLACLALVPVQAIAQSVETRQSVLENPQTAPSQLEPEMRTGSRLPTRPSEMEDTATRRMGKDFAKCTYQRNPALAERVLLASDPATVDLSRAGIEGEDLHEKFALSDCLEKAMSLNQSRVMLRFESRLLRVMFAEEAYLAFNKSPLDLPDGATELVSDRVILDDNPRARGLGNFSDCLVYHGANEADAILRSRPGTSQEMEAVRALVPAISSCLTEGQEVALTPGNVRGLVADGLWTRSHYANRNTETPAQQDASK